MTDPSPNNLPGPLSPAAQAVMDAAFPVYDDEVLYVATGEQHAGMIAAAFRAAATHLGSCNASEELIRIAEELEGK